MKKYLIRYLLEFKFVAQNMRAPRNNLVGFFAAKVMAEANDKSVADAVNRLQIQTGEHVLELGSGNGYGLQCMESKSPGRLIGVEISERFREMIQQRKLKNLEIYEQDAINMSNFIPSNSIDKMLAMNVVYFLDPLSAYAIELKRILKKGTGLGILGCKPKAIATGNTNIFKNKSIDDIKKTLLASGLDVHEELIDLGNPVESYTALKIRNPI